MPVPTPGYDEESNTFDVASLFMIIVDRQFFCRRQEGYNAIKKSTDFAEK
jgi:hypothetical protein